MKQLQGSMNALYYEDLGNGYPVLFLTGVLGTGETDFSDQLPWFANRYRVIAPDFRGYGRSRPPARTYPPDFYQRDAEEMAGLMNGIGLEQYAVVGWSDGANCAALMASRYPERVTQLVMWGGNSFLTAEDIEIFNEMRDLATWSPRAVEPLRVAYGEDLEGLWSSYIDGLESIYAQGGELYRQQLERIACPTLVLHGDLDPVVPMRHFDVIQAGIKGSETFRFEAGKHNIHKRFSVVFNEIVSSFLARSGAC